MEHYSKGKNVLEDVTRADIPIPNLPETYHWMQVSAGSKVRNLMPHALKGFGADGAVVWSGSGAAVGKVISCAEVMKRHLKDAHQVTKICYRRVEEHWEPKADDLDALVVVRELPMIHILLSRQPLNADEPGYQPPGSHKVFWKLEEAKDGNKRPKQPKKSPATRVDSEQFADMGLRSAKRHKKPNKNNVANTKKTIA